MQIKPFATEHFYARYEFSAPHLLSVSDCETLSVAELLALADMSLDDLGALELGYTESQGNPALRQAVAETYKSVLADEVVVLASPIEGIYLTMRSLLEPGDEAIVLTPAYDALKNLPEHICETVRPWPLTPTEGGWRLDFEGLEQLITPKTKLLVLNFPHNPTGFLPSPTDFQKLMNVAERYGIWVYSDEMYRGLELSAPQLSSTYELYDRSIVLSGLSKTYGLPGLRAGWLVIRDKTLRDRVMNWKMYTSICPPAPSEFLTQVALSVRAQIAERNKNIIRQNLELAEAFFGRWQTLFTWRAPQAGSVALIELDVPSATAYCHTLAEEAGVVLLPSAFLGFEDTFVRFGFGRRNFGLGLERYEGHLNQALT